MGFPITIDGGKPITVSHVISIEPGTLKYLSDLLARSAAPPFDFAAAFAALEKSMSDQIDALEASMAKLAADVDTLAGAEVTFADTVKALQATSDTLKASNVAIQAALDAANAGNAINVAELSKANDAVTAADAKIVELTAAIKALGGTPPADNGGVTTG